ncbi:HD domain-containing protein [Domibacillus robiginosus]|uniref:HD domain-containing protein n=1 Tax=Domibacillus robiginosus TaxID=1071054 RepID=UPI00067BDD42|nr:HD domain-containing protein [Domibacillus robiginosus]
MEKIVSEGRFLEYILNSMDESLILIDQNLKIQYVNPSGERLFGLEGLPYQGKHIYNESKFVQLPFNYDKKVLDEVLQTGKARKDVLRKTFTGRTLSMNAIPLVEEGVKKGVLVTGKDVTDIVDMQNEIDMAFALTLPNSKVEYKLKNTVEYNDIYDPQTKMITITGIISDGGYRHVVNCLKLLSHLYQKGIAKVIGIDKDQLVQAFIFHDLGKTQPVLSIGDIVDPKKAFEDGKLHAYRGAEIAKQFYSVHEDIVEIIRYHHHGEHELPGTFPWRLRPMYRLFQVVDGLSASITRGGGKVEFSVQDCTLTITEINHRPQYNGTWQVDLFTGTKRRLES